MTAQLLHAQSVVIQAVILVLKPEPPNAHPAQQITISLAPPALLAHQVLHPPAQLLKLPVMVKGFLLIFLLSFLLACEDANCKTCDSFLAGSCTVCVDGYAWDSTNKECKTCEDTGCATCSATGTSQCTSCDAGYVLNGNICDPCATGCTECGSGSCSTCDADYYFDGTNTCVQCPDKTYSEVDNTLTACKGKDFHL